VHYNILSSYAVDQILLITQVATYNI
jgi:hypothetical protein